MQRGMHSLSQIGRDPLRLCPPFTYVRRARDGRGGERAGAPDSESAWGNWGRALKIFSRSVLGDFYENLSCRMHGLYRQEAIDTQNAAKVRVKLE